MSTELEDLVTDDDLAALGDEDTSVVEENTDDDAGARDKFGGDSDKLASSYKELEKKLGQQGSEIGEVKQILQQMITASKSGDDSAEGDGFLKDLEEQMESGALTVSAAFKSLYEHLNGKFDEEIKGRSDRDARVERNARVWSGFIDSNPDAKKLEPLMVKIAKAKPHLIPTGAEESVVMDALGDVLTLAKNLVAQARAKKRGGSMDAGTSRRINPRRLRKGSRESELFDRARDSDHERDWAKVIESIM
jgi:hypothetical protein